MLFQLSSIAAFSATCLFSFATPGFAGHSRFHRHQPRVPLQENIQEAANGVTRRSDSGSVDIPLSELQLLRTEMTAFQGWMQSWIKTANASDPATSVAQLKLEFQAYDSWMTSWLDSTLSPSSSAPPPLPSSVPITTSASSVAISSVLTLSTTSARPQLPVSPSSARIQTASTSAVGGKIFQSSKPSPATTLISIPSKIPTSSIKSESPLPSTISTPSFKPLVFASPASKPIKLSTAPISGSNTFDADSSSNVAVYYGQSGATSQTTLGQMCQDDNVDIVVLAFLNNFFGAGGYPSLNLGAACGGPSVKMQAAGATGLLSCPNMEKDITTCQGLGKKILLSLGGAEATTAFSSDSQASDFANKLWNLFGGGKGESDGMRPFGNAVVDGFDIDNEDHSTAFYSSFVSSLRTAMNSDSSKKYYISAAPQCPRPDASIPLDAMQSMDFVFVQFYNNGDCNVGQPGFEASLKAWSQDLAAKGKGPKLYIGAPACTECAGSGYLPGSQMGGVLDTAKAAGLSNLGGVMLWDGPEGKQNVENGQDYLEIVKSALG